MLNSSRTALRDRAIHAFNAGVAAADPVRATQRALSQHFDAKQLRGDLYVVAFGKAALGMAKAALAVLPEGKAKHVLAVTNYENATNSEGIEVLAAGHPVPDENGAAAAARVEALLQVATQDDVVIALVSGGASALLPAPISGLTLDDKSRVNALLLGSGMDIGSMNVIRQSLSRTKGGKLLANASPARVVSFVLSDVLGDDLRLVGSGPTIGRVGNNAQACDLLREAKLWQDLPKAAQEVLLRPEQAFEQPSPEAYLIGSNALSLQAMAETLPAQISPIPLEGDVQSAAERIIQEVLSAPSEQALAFGGETTVVLNGDGLGGRNQELALRVAQEAKSMELSGSWVFLSGGTDGRDGPTDAAGGVVDDLTLHRLADKGLSLPAILENNDSYRALKAAGDLLMTGATGTNVADLQLFLRAP